MFLLYIHYFLKTFLIHIVILHHLQQLIFWTFFSPFKLYCSIFTNNSIFLIFNFYAISLLLKLSNIVININTAHVPSTANENPTDIPFVAPDAICIVLYEILFTNILSANPKVIKWYIFNPICCYIIIYYIHNYS